MSEDSASLSNLSIASYSLSQHSCDNASYTNPTVCTPLSPLTVSSPQPPPPPVATNDEGDKMSRKQYSSSYRNLADESHSPTSARKITTNNSRRSGDATRPYQFGSTNPSVNSSATSSQKSFPIKTAETVLNTIGITASSNNDLTDKCGLIANDGNDLDNNEDEDHHHHPFDDVQSFSESHYVDSSDENELDMTASRHSTGTSSQTGRGLRKTVLNNMDRLLNSGSKQIKL